MLNDILFSGKIITYGLLFPTATISNMKELVRVCPVEFKDENNPWFCLVSNILKFGFFNELFDDDNFKTPNKNTRNIQVWYFYALYKTIGIKPEDKAAVMGWMLSEIIISIPEYPERKRKDFQNIEKFLPEYQNSS